MKKLFHKSRSSAPTLPSRYSKRSTVTPGTVLQVIRQTKSAGDAEQMQDPKRLTSNEDIIVDDKLFPESPSGDFTILRKAPQQSYLKFAQYVSSDALNMIQNGMLRVAMIGYVYGKMDNLSYSQGDVLVIVGSFSGASEVKHGAALQRDMTVIQSLPYKYKLMFFHPVDVEELKKIPLIETVVTFIGGITVAIQGVKFTGIYGSSPVSPSDVTVCSKTPISAGMYKTHYAVPGANSMESSKEERFTSNEPRISRHRLQVVESPKPDELITLEPNSNSYQVVPLPKRPVWENSVPSFFDEPVNQTLDVSSPPDTLKSPESTEDMPALEVVTTSLSDTDSILNHENTETTVICEPNRCEMSEDVHSLQTCIASEVQETTDINDLRAIISSQLADNKRKLSPSSSKSDSAKSCMIATESQPEPKISQSPSPSESSKYCLTTASSHSDVSKQTLTPCSSHSEQSRYIITSTSYQVNPVQPDAQKAAHPCTVCIAKYGSGVILFYDTLMAGRAYRWKSSLHVNCNTKRMISRGKFTATVYEPFVVDIRM